MSASPRRTFDEVLTMAVADLTDHGFDSPGRVEYWANMLQEAAERVVGPAYKREENLRRGLETIYRRLVERGGLAKRHRGVGRFVLERVRPSLRAELDRRIYAAADLIKLNKERAVESTLQRLKGWATSLPAGGSDVVDKREVKQNVRKALGSLSFEERRVVVDQGHKLVSSLSDILAREGGALAGVWHSHWRQSGYNYREDHRERDSVVYAVRGNWAIAKGLMKAPHGYTDEIEQPGEFVYCRCYYQWIYALRDLPRDMLTARGIDELARVKREIRGDSAKQTDEGRTPSDRADARRGTEGRGDQPREDESASVS
jgi:hypothetical protein